MARKREHLYREGGKKRVEPEFEKRYGKKKGDYVYGSVVGKVKRERDAKAKRRKGSRLSA